MAAIDLPAIRSRLQFAPDAVRRDVVALLEAVEAVKAVGVSLLVVASLAEAVEVLERMESGGEDCPDCLGCGRVINHAHDNHNHNCDVAHALDRIEDARCALGLLDPPGPDGEPVEHIRDDDAASGGEGT